jgi:hypothetical protein
MKIYSAMEEDGMESSRIGKCRHIVVALPDFDVKR